MLTRRYRRHELIALALGLALGVGSSWSPGSNRNAPHSIAVTQSGAMGRAFFWPPGDAARPPARLYGSIRLSFARWEETFFAFGFLLQFDPSVRDLQQRCAMFFRHRHCQTLTFLRESPVRCGVTHRCPPIPAWRELSRNFGFLFTKI
jgi:hypothetical protein